MQYITLFGTEKELKHLFHDQKVQKSLKIIETHPRNSMAFKTSVEKSQVDNIVLAIMICAVLNSNVTFGDRSSKNLLINSIGKSKQQ